MGGLFYPLYLWGERLWLGEGLAAVILIAVILLGAFRTLVEVEIPFFRFVAACFD